MNITRIEPTSDDRSGTPTLLAVFDVETPNAVLRNCKLLESGTGECFILPPQGLKFWDDAPLRSEICEAALDALDEIEPSS